MSLQMSLFRSSGCRFGMLVGARVGKMMRHSMLVLLPVAAPAVAVQPRSSVRCSSHNATSSEDAFLASFSLECQHVRIRGRQIRSVEFCSYRLLSGKPFINILKAGGHTFKGDLGAEPWGAGGTAPEPKDYAYAALALCTSMTVRLYANRKKWPLKHVEVEVQEINGKPGQVPDGLHAILKLEGDLTDEQKQELIRISATCPIKQMFSGKMKGGITSEIAGVVSSV